MSRAIAHVRADGRTEQLLSEHLRNVGLTCRHLAAKIGLPNQGELMGLLHDLGKYSAEFQSYIRSAVGLINPDEDEYVDAEARKGKIDHSTAGAQLIYRHLSSRGKFGPFAGQIMALGLVSHHSGMVDCISPDGRDIFFKRIKKDDARTHLIEVRGKADKVILDRVLLLLSQPETVNAAQGFSSAIAKEDLQPGIDPVHNPITQLKFGLFIRYLYSCLLDADRIDSANFENPNAATQRNLWMYESWEVLADRLERHLKTFKSEAPIDNIRKEISERCRSRASDPNGIFTLTVPTGGGKTLASLRFALHHAKEHKLDRIIFVVPFTTIIDQNAATVREILEPANTDAGSIVLEHHSNLLPNKETWKGKLLAENWDAPVIFTTTVQFLECLFGAGTRDARRMHQLARSILVFDEIQTLPVRCVHLFCNAINF
jgi:CRISPR-associated endonuclease/helicase Cas3